MKQIIWQPGYMGMVHLRDYYKLSREDQLAFLNGGNKTGRLFNVVESQQFNREKIDYLIKLAQAIKRLYEEPTEQGRKFLASLLSHKRMICYFAEASTRTMHSFVIAAKLLGISAKTEHQIQLSSMYKGETFSDTIRTLAQYYDLFAIRHPKDDSSEKAIVAMNGIRESQRPILNAGSGSAQHPTQAFLDLLTIRDEVGRLDNLRIVIVGDPKYGRTVNSKVYLLVKNYKGNEFYFISPKQLRIKDGLRESLNKHGAVYHELETMDPEVLSKADVVYMTRVQKERLGFWERKLLYPTLKGRYIFTLDHLRSMKKGSIVMHPLPRVYEFQVEEYHDPDKVAIWRQVRNGVYMRAALIANIYGIDEEILLRAQNT